MKNETIWVVDDDPIFRLIFTMTLKKCFPDYIVVEHNDGKAACDAFLDCALSGKDIPHSIFMDINMPVMNGWECLEQIQSAVNDVDQESHPALYIVSSSINPEDEKKAVSYPITSAYLVKPITVEVFKEILG